MICCVTCKRPFNNLTSLQQHMLTFQDAPTHTSLPVLWLPTLGALAEQINSSDSSDDEPLLTPSTSNTSSPDPLKPFTCHICRRSFRTTQAIAAHLRDAPNHSPAFSCKDCQRCFRTDAALREHKKAKGHIDVDFTCKPCNRLFKTEAALHEHTQNAPAHTRVYWCQPCNRSFGSKASLDEHTREAKVHNLSFGCAACARVFKSQLALNDHIRDSHAPLVCRCNRQFKDAEALGQHLRDAPVHNESSSSPLDAFFTAFPGFNYDPRLSPSKSFEALVSFNEWEEGSPDGQDAWVLWQEAMGEEIRQWAESEDDIFAWHALCLLVGATPLPATCEEAKKAVIKKLLAVVEMAVRLARQGR